MPTVADYAQLESNLAQVLPAIRPKQFEMVSPQRAPSVSIDCYAQRLLRLGESLQNGAKRTQEPGC